MSVYPIAADNMSLFTFTDQSNHVSGLKVTFTPSAVVSEGQRVTLTCSTSCPLTDNTNYIWYLNRQHLALPENQNKHLVLDPVSTQNAGNYCCAVKTHQNIRSPENTLTVQSITMTWTLAAPAGVCAALLVLIPLAVFLWIRWATLSCFRAMTFTHSFTSPIHFYIHPLHLPEERESPANLLDLKPQTTWRR